MACMCLVSCAICQQTKLFTITVEPYMVVSNDAFFRVMHLSSSDESTDYIEGFDYEWGYTYVLKVKRTILKNPPMDGSDRTYSLVKVISKTPVPENYQFKLTLIHDLYLGPGEQASTFTAINDSTFSYFEKIEVVVPSALREEFDQKIVGENYHKGTFVFAEENRIRLIKIDG